MPSLHSMYAIDRAWPRQGAGQSRSSCARSVSIAWGLCCMKMMPVLRAANMPFRDRGRVQDLQKHAKRWPSRAYFTVAKTSSAIPEIAGIRGHVPLQSPSHCRGRGALAPCTHTTADCRGSSTCGYRVRMEASHQAASGLADPQSLSTPVRAHAIALPLPTVACPGHSIQTDKLEWCSRSRPVPRSGCCAWCTTPWARSKTSPRP